MVIGEVDVIANKKREKGKRKQMEDKSIKRKMVKTDADAAHAQSMELLELNTISSFLYTDTEVQRFFRHHHNSVLEYAMMFPSVNYILILFNKLLTGGQMTRLIVDSVSKAISERSKNPEIKSMDFVQLMLDHRED
ncbi:hypothetical protein AVEN_50929-1, partial [Araneus ventricosus]